MSSNVDNDNFGKIYEEELLVHRLKDPDAELARLESNKKVQKVFNQVKAALSKQHKIALGHIVELRKRFKEKYYVLMHGQNSELMMINLVAEKLEEIVKGKPSVAAIPLRHPCFTKHIKSSQTPSWFRRKCNRFAGGDHKFRTELICADALLSSTAGAESANYFAASGNSNIASGFNVKNFVMNNLRKQLKSTFPGKNIEPLLEIFEKLFEKIPSHMTSGGNLYAICIPKKKFTKCGYVSSGFGVSHPLSKKQTDETIVNKLQHDKVVGGGKKQGFFGKKMVPQVRLITSKLTPENGVRVIQESLLPEELVDQIESIIEEVVERAHEGESFVSIKKDLFARGFKKKTKSEKAIEAISNVNEFNDTQETSTNFFDQFFKTLSTFFVSFFKKIFSFIKSE